MIRLFFRRNFLGWGVVCLILVVFPSFCMADEISDRLDARQPSKSRPVASHGYFGGSPEQNFIMTYDKLMDMPMLEALVKPKQFAAHPVEMITLSACQTAEGDDRSPLGLTGIALKSGARSAMGTLWPVSDAAAQTLFPAFYRQLQDPSKTKAEALRQAQLQLLRKSEFHHPFYWSPFILVGNWM
ncbi:MAG: CHAT domain-containing protein [Pseudomonadota bacterium]